VSRTIVAPLVRSLVGSDRVRVEKMTRATGLFRAEEIPVALEVFDAAVGYGRRPDPDYESAGAEVDGYLVGWISWGPTPGTSGTFHLYWIVVDPTWQNRGVGSALMDEMERRLSRRARMVVVETAGRADYASTRAFYAGRAYRVAAEIHDYYSPGDDLVLFVKQIGGRGQGAGARAFASPLPGSLPAAL
jgi:ribosomal protein S18 acetylase RimI-like enzyme